MPNRANRTEPDDIRAPTLWAARKEWRVPFEFANSVLRTRSLGGWPRGDGHPVIVVPGFLAAAESTVFLRRLLRRLGYGVHDWGLGRNRGITPERSAALGDLAVALHDQYGSTVSVIGWSAGGVYARELGRTMPQHTRSVVTLASPFNEHLPSTPAWRAYKLVNPGVQSDAFFATEAVRLRAEPLPVPTTSIYSRSDGIVAWQACASTPSPLNESVEVGATHMGMAHQIEALRVIADRLSQPVDGWVPYADTSRPGLY